jgi:carbon-monoxide dehydrogenase catalytic subunit
MAKKLRTPEEASFDPASIDLLQLACDNDIETAFSRADSMAACPIGADGMCCKVCSMGPCRLVKKGQTGICGATLETVAARNFARMVAAGSAAHSDHGRGMAYTLLEAAEGHAPDYQVRDLAKLEEIAGYLDVEVDGKPVNELAREVALAALHEFGKAEGEFKFLRRAPAKRQEIWKKLDVVPRNIDREIVEMMHRTHVGNDQDAEHILDHALRCSIGDGWGGSMLGTDISDILFGTPAPVLSSANLGILQDEEVNIVIHGHEPSLSEMIIAAAQDPELIEYAKSKGAKGITMGGICCTANEALMRQGVPLAGNFLQQELAIITGAVDAMVVDIQCIMQGIVKLAENYQTVPHSR